VDGNRREGMAAARGGARGYRMVNIYNMMGKAIQKERNFWAGVLGGGVVVESWARSI